MPLAFQALERIGWYYDATGQNAKCAQTWLRMSDYCPQKGWWLGDMWLMSARALEKEGKHEEAQKLRENVPAVGNGWITALAAYEAAQSFVNAGKLEEAKAILSRPLNATEQVTDGRIAQTAWLASLAYEHGDLQEAFRLGQIVEEIAKLNKNINGPVKSLYDIGHNVYLRAGGWKNQPIQSDVKELNLKTNPSQPNQPLYARFRIKTYGDTTVTATVDSPSAQVRVLHIDNWQNGALKDEREVILEVKTNEHRRMTLLLLSSNGTKTQVPISLTE